MKMCSDIGAEAEEVTSGGQKRRKGNETKDEGRGTGEMEEERSRGFRSDETVRPNFITLLGNLRNCRSLLLAKLELEQA